MVLEVIVTQEAEEVAEDTDKDEAVADVGCEGCKDLPLGLCAGNLDRKTVCR